MTRRSKRSPQATSGVSTASGEVKKGRGRPKRSTALKQNGLKQTTNGKVNRKVHGKQDTQVKGKGKGKGKQKHQANGKGKGKGKGKAKEFDPKEWQHETAALQRELGRKRSSLETIKSKSADLEKEINILEQQISAKSSDLATFLIKQH